MSKLTVIMPAAGKGTRLNLPYPKEILRLDKEQALIDYSFDFFRWYPKHVKKTLPSERRKRIKNVGPEDEVFL